MKEKYLKINPSGTLEWIELDRLPRHNDTPLIQLYEED